MRVFDTVFGAGYGALMTWGFIIIGSVAPAILLIFSINREWVIKGSVIAAFLTGAAMWIKRFLIIVPALTQPLLEGLPEGSYSASWVELSITAGAFALFGLLFVIFIRIFPLISFWEMEELATEEAAVKAVQEALASS